MLLLSFAGMCSPKHAIKHSNPTVFKVTVFPPVFGPVIINDLKSFPRFISIGTTESFEIKGCLACFKSINFSVLMIGSTPSIALEYDALANIKSIFPINSTVCLILSVIGKSNFDKFSKIFSISIDLLI